MLLLPLRRKRFVPVFGLLLLAMAVSGCGYRLRGTRSLSGGWRKVAIGIFTNRTYESRIENYLHDALVEEFARNRNLEVVAPEEAELMVCGDITRISSYAISYSADDKTYEYRVVLTLNVEVVEAGSGRTVWHREGMNEVDEYKANLEPLTIDRNRQQALQRICRVLAENIHDRLFTDF